MDDRELLELAAKVAGEKVLWVTKDGSLARCGVEWNQYNWTPHRDDGQALQLAVKLSFSVIIDRECSACSIHDEDDVCIWIEDFHHADPYVATRRAIVRAAAEIGKTL